MPAKRNGLVHVRGVAVQIIVGGHLLGFKKTVPQRVFVRAVLKKAGILAVVLASPVVHTRLEQANVPRPVKAFPFLGQTVHPKEQPQNVVKVSILPCVNTLVDIHYFRF